MHSYPKCAGVTNIHSFGSPGDFSSFERRENHSSIFGDPNSCHLPDHESPHLFERVTLSSTHMVSFYRLGVETGTYAPIEVIAFRSHKPKTFIQGLSFFRIIEGISMAGEARWREYRNSIFSNGWYKIQRIATVVLKLNVIRKINVAVGERSAESVIHLLLPIDHRIKWVTTRKGIPVDLEIDIKLLECLLSAPAVMREPIRLDSNFDFVSTNVAGKTELAMEGAFARAIPNFINASVGMLALYLSRFHSSDWSCRPGRWLFTSVHEVSTSEFTTEMEMTVGQSSEH